MKIYKNEIQNLNSEKLPKQELNTDNRNPKLLKAAQMYEQNFLNEMVKAMRSTVGKSDLIEENMAEKIFKDKLFDNYVETWTEKGGVGLADLIYDEVIEKYQAVQPQKIQGPLPVRQEKFLSQNNEAVDNSNLKVGIKENGLYGVSKPGIKNSK